MKKKVDGRVFMCEFLCDYYGTDTPGPAMRQLVQELPLIDEALVEMVTAALNYKETEKGE